MDELDLISGLKTKQPSAINYFVNNYQQMVFVLCVKMLHNNEVAEEITQDVFIKCIEKIDQFKSASKLKTWVYTVARREVLNYIRINQIATKELTEIESNKFGHNEIEEDLTKKEMQSLIQNQFEKLPVEQKEILTHFYLNEFSLNEIARLCELTEENVRVKLFRARKAFKNSLTTKEVSLINQLRYE